LQYTIEARHLTNEYTHRPAHEAHPQRIVIEASDAGEAIKEFVNGHQSELVSFLNPGRGQESIGTVRKDDSIYLVRVYAA
jgi:hypothetical protein